MQQASPPTFGRRPFLLAGLASAATLLACSRGAGTSGAGDTTSPPSLEAFLAWSARLTGRTNLSPEAARIYLDALLAHPETTTLLAILVSAEPGTPAPSEAHTTLERDVLAAWYTGICVVNGQRHAASHATALMWPAIGLNAPGTCAATPNAWSSPPVTQAKA